MKKNILFRICPILAALLLGVLPLSAQTQYKATVVDEADRPIVGATAVVKGTSNGTTTGVDGSFILAVPAKATVQVSFLGYITEEIDNFAQTKIVLKEDKQQIEEVVVVGYGAQKKAHLTGSVATVPMDEIQDLASGDLGSTLAGLMNGVSVSGGDQRPGSRATIYIRDVNSLNAVGSSAQEPLYVIDGYIYPNDVKIGNSTQNLGAEAFSTIDPSTVESISVLKDAAAAVYGARAANGVVLVTTKRGKQGAPQISYSGTFGIADVFSHPKMLNAYQYGKLWNAVKTADPFKLGSELDRTTNLFQLDELAAMKGLNYDLLDKYWKTAVKQKHSFNISGATEKVNYFAGISYFDQGGNLGQLSYDRWNYRAGIDVKITDWLKGGLSVTGDYGKKNKPNVKIGGSNDENDYNWLLMRPRYIPEEVNGLPIAAYGIDNAGGDKQHYNYGLMQRNGDYSRSMSSNINIAANLEMNFDWCKLLKGLTMRLSYAKSITQDKTNQYASSFTLYSMSERAGSGRHLYTPIPGQEAAYEELMNADNFVAMKLKNGSDSYLSREMTRTDNYQLNFQMNYARDFGKHHVGAMFAIEKSESESEYLKGWVSDPYAFTTGQSNSAEAGTKEVTFTRNVSGTLSYLGRLNYAYADKYLLEVLLRVDSSTKFAPENYWGYFPAVSAGWVVSKESWFADNVKWIDFLKLRASFGLTGRDNCAPWQWMQVYAQDGVDGPVFGTGTTNDPNNRITINKNNSAVNRDVHWDKSYKGNVGIDWNVLNNRLGFTIEGYYEWNREMLLNLAQNVPATVGTQSASVNLGEMDSWGIEFSTTWRANIGRNFKYRIGLNTGYSDNKVKVADFKTEGDSYFQSIRPGGRTDTGMWGLQCIGMFRSFQQINEYFDRYDITSYMGMSKEDVRPGMLIYKDVRGAFDKETLTYGEADGIVNGNDKVRLSNRSNPYHFTLNLGAEWKSLSLTAQISASWGGYRLVPSQARKMQDLEVYSMPSFWNPDHMFVYQDVLDANGNVLVAENRDAHYPNLAYGINAEDSSFWRVSDTQVKLNRLTLAYTLPKKWLKPIGISSMRINVTGTNLFSFCNPYPDKFMDPMSGTYGRYPTLRNFTVGVNVSF